MSAARFARIAGLAGLAALAPLAAPPAALATPVTLARTESRVDYVSAGVGGVGSGPGTITIAGVDGPVRRALLYWHGIDQNVGGSYDNQNVTLDDQQVTGTSLGDASTNCWGPGSSRAFVADVTSLVDGNGSYVVDGLDNGFQHSGNGASLVVIYDDGDDSNDRDLVFFEGNDSDIIQLGDPPGDTNGWAATLSNIAYAGGTVLAQMHVGDGQFFDDGPVTFSGAGTVSIFDTTQLWDGKSVPNAGFSRAGTDSLWDIHTFDVTGAFGAPGQQTINFSGMLTTGDCHSLVLLMLDLEGGSAPCGNGVVDEGEECDPAGDSQCPGAQTCVSDCTCGCQSDLDCGDGSGCTIDSCNLQTGECLYTPACPTGPGCEDTCDEQAGQCRQCGHPFSNDRCVVNAVFVLQAALDLRSCELCTCDVDSSGEVTATDSLKILRTCAGLPESLECTYPESSTTTTLFLP